MKACAAHEADIDAANLLHTQLTELTQHTRGHEQARVRALSDAVAQFTALQRQMSQAIEVIASGQFLFARPLPCSHEWGSLLPCRACARSWARSRSA